MGRVEDRESLDHLGVIHRGDPGDAPAPVVTDQQRRLSTPLLDQAPNIGGEQLDRVGLETLRLRRQVIATRVGDDHPKTGRHERLDL